MNITKHFNKDNLHHAYLIEGKREEVLPDIFIFMKTLGIPTSQNPDFCEIEVDNFKIEEALNLRSMADQKSFTTNKKIFIISVHRFSLDAEHALLKMFEEPIENTYFFMIMPDTNALLKTLISRFYLIKGEIRLEQNNEEVKKFISMSFKDRINFTKELLIESSKEGEDVSEIIEKDSTRSKALRFLNTLELVLHKKISFKKDRVGYFHHLLKVREFLRQPGSSTKSLMESVALVIPEKLF